MYLPHLAQESLRLAHEAFLRENWAPKRQWRNVIGNENHNNTCKDSFVLSSLDICIVSGALKLIFLETNRRTVFLFVYPRVEFAHHSNSFRDVRFGLSASGQNISFGANFLGHRGTDNRGRLCNLPDRPVALARK